MVSERWYRWWYFTLLNYFVSQQNTKAIPLPQISNAIKNGKKLFSQNTPRWFSKRNKAHTPEKSSKSPSTREDSVNDSGKNPLWSLIWQSIQPWDCEWDTCSVSSKEKKLCFVLEHCSVLFSILSLSEPTRDYLRDILENNGLEKKPHQTITKYKGLANCTKSWSLILQSYSNLNMWDVMQTYRSDPRRTRTKKFTFSILHASLLLPFTFHTSHITYV